MRAAPVVDLLQRPHHLRHQPRHPLAATSLAGTTQKAVDVASTRSADIAHLMAARELDGIMPRGVPSPIMPPKASQGWTHVVLGWWFQECHRLKGQQQVRL